jgi:L-threonylcarbamoyladenylate synthase
MPANRTFESIPEEIKSAVDYVVKFRQNDKTVANASAVIKWTDGKVEVIRE